MIRPLLLTLALSGCASAPSALRAEMEPLRLAAPAPAPLQENHFKGDKSAVVDEDAIRAILQAPVFLEEKARVGVLPVQTRYAIDRDVPLTEAPAAVSEALERSGLFEVTTEVSTDWPTDSGIPGLRELASRYRCEYLLLYRHRFVDREWTNGWAAMWLTVLGGFFVPQTTLETAGVLEATLFDVKTGTLLYTVYERVHATADENVWQNERKRRALKQRLLGEAAQKLAEKVVGKTRRLAAARPEAPAVLSAGPNM